MSDIETLKILLIGNSSAGKSSLLLRFINDVWEPEDSQATIGVDFKTKLLSVNGQKVKLTIWDTAGQERFRTLTSSYYRGCQGVLVVFDVSNRASYEQIPKWFDELASHMSGRLNPAVGGGGEDDVEEEGQVVAFVVGNKTDRPGRVVTLEEGEAMVQRVGAAGYLEASAKDGSGVKQVFSQLTQRVLERQAKMQKRVRRTTEGVRIANDPIADSGCAC